MHSGQERRRAARGAAFPAKPGFAAVLLSSAVTAQAAHAAPTTPVPTSDPALAGSGRGIEASPFQAGFIAPDAPVTHLLSAPVPLALSVLTLLCAAIFAMLIFAEVLRRLRRLSRRPPSDTAVTAVTPTGATDSIALLDEDARVVEANAIFRSETGLSMDQIRGRPIWALHRKGFGKAFWDRALAEARATGTWTGQSRTLGHAHLPETEGLTVTARPSPPDTAAAFEFRSQSQQSLRPEDPRAPEASLRDTLTTLPSRRAMKTQVEMAIARAATSGVPFALMVVDLDRFRDINSIFGDDIGDRVLERLAGALQSAAHPGVTVGRLGGDEFILLVEQVATSDALIRVAADISAALGDEVEVDGLTCRLSASIGVAQYPKDGTCQRDLMQAAGVSLCHAKTRGRGQVCFYSENLAQRSEDSLQMEADLRRAISEGELLMFYQPQVDLRTGRCIGAEALLRWQHPQKGLLLPGGFVPLALDTGLTTAIDRFVMREVCAQFGAWQSAGYLPVNLSINVSATSLLAPEFAEELSSLAKRHDIDLRRLELEVLESTMFPRMRSSLNTIEDLRSQGIRLAIDDFGTGYSSLAMLKDLPIDRIKLDRRFIKSLPRNLKDDRIVAAVVAMGRSLDISVIAEGVETREQRDRLIALGCPQAQGYLFSRPVSAEDFSARWMKHRAPASYVGVSNAPLAAGSE